MELGAFKSFRMALGMGGDEEEEATKPRADSGSSNGSSSGSSRGGRRRRRDGGREREIQMPLNRDFVPLADDDDHGRHHHHHGGGGGATMEDERARDQVREDVICMIFDLPRGTTFLQDFSCAIAAAFPMHGRMYPTGTHVCFYSNVFGRERKILIPYESIADISKTTSLVLFQGAIRIKTTTGEYYTFTSFWGANRDHCFDLIASTRRRVLGLKAEGEDDANGSAAVSPTADAARTAEEPDDREGETDDGKGCTLPRTVSDCGIVSAPRDISMELLLEERFPVSVDGFLAAFVLDDAPFGLPEYNERIGTTEMQCHPWSEPDADGSLSRTRALQFRVPVDAPIGPKSSMVDVLQCLKTGDSGARVIETSTRLVDIPYGDYFSVEDRWTLTPHPRDANVCTLTIEIKVVFSKSTFWRSQIESRAISDNRAKWTQWAQVAREFLAAEDASSSPPSSSTSTSAVVGQEPASSNGTPSPAPIPQSSPRKRLLSKRLSGLGIEPSDVRRSRSSPTHRQRSPRAAAQAFPWVLVLILILIIFLLTTSISRLEERALANEKRLVEIQEQLMAMRSEHSVCR